MSESVSVLRWTANFIYSVSPSTYSLPVHVFSMKSTKCTTSQTKWYHYETNYGTTLYWEQDQKQVEYIGAGSVNGNIPIVTAGLDSSTPVTLIW